MTDAPPPRDLGDLDAIAAEVARAASETGLGFLLARIATDQLLDGSLAPDPSTLRRELYGRAAEVLLSDRHGADVDADSVLLQAASVASAAGVPLGDVWEAAAVALRAEIDASLDAQLDLLARRRRFMVAERVGDEVLYRLFHPALRDYFAGLSADARRLVASALVDLRERQAAGWATTDRVAPFLLSHLPGLLAHEPDSALLQRALAGAPAPVREAQVQALVEASLDRGALGDNDGALDRSTAAVTIATQYDVTTPARVEALLAYAESSLSKDNWRAARDASREAIGGAARLLADNDEDTDPAPLGLYVRAVCRYVRAQGSGSFDVEDGIQAADVTVGMLERSAPTALAAIGADVADLLLSYSDSLDNDCPPRVVLDALDAAAQILRAFIRQGRRELGVQLAVVLAHTGFERLRIDDPSGFDSLREATNLVLQDAPLSPNVIVRVNPIIGELAQNLGIVGHHAEALEWLDRFIGAYEPVVRAARTREAYPLQLVDLLLIRSAVCAALGRDEDALADARRATAFDDTPPYIVRQHSGSSILGLRLLEARRYDEVSRVADLDFDAIGRPRHTGERVGGLAHAMQLHMRGKSEGAVDVLAAILGRLEREAEPVDRVVFSMFIDYAPELQVGVLLAEVHRDRGDYPGAQRALETAMRTFLGSVGHWLPVLLLHVRPTVLEEYRDLLSAVIAGSVPESTATEWADASHVLAEGGRPALAAWQASRPLRTGRQWQMGSAMRELQFTELGLDDDAEGLIVSLEDDGHAPRARAMRTIVEKTVEGLRRASLGSMSPQGRSATTT